MRQHLKQILFLIVASVVFTELLTGNVSIIQFAIDPILPIFLFTVGYGFPVLLIRELAVKWRSGLLSIFLLGLAYGILNEGILAKTLLMDVDVPMRAFDGYAGSFGVNYAWAAVIVSWHAFFAVIFPILTSHAIFPGKARTNWLSKKMFWILAVLVSTAGSAIFLLGETHGISGTPALFAVFVSAMAVLICLAWLLRKKMPIGTSSGNSNFKLLLIAFVFVILVLHITSILGSMKASIWWIFAVVLFVTTGLFSLLKKCGWVNTSSIAIFALCTYISFGLFVFLLNFTINPIIAATVVVLELIFLLLILRIFKKNNK